jgi:excisionase family DNA binding protein
MQTLADTRRLLLVGEVAEMGRCSPDTVRRAAAAGDLPSVRIGPAGKLLRFRIGDIDRWLGAQPEEARDGAA